MRTTVRKICLIVCLSVLIGGYVSAQCTYPSTPSQKIEIGYTSTSGGGWGCDTDFTVPSGATPYWMIYNGNSVGKTLSIDSSFNGCIYLMGNLNNTPTPLTLLYANSGGKQLIDLTPYNSYVIFYVEVYGITSGHMRLMVF